MFAVDSPCPALQRARYALPQVGEKTPLSCLNFSYGEKTRLPACESFQPCHMPWTAWWQGAERPGGV
jgi:hypothetical protein